ncbi:pteridine reductase [Thiohalophilus thiocyanatoxydans]|uniref:Pteridine reductase n=1 Tax=Thiohalophilus thiocyanatoxydans TaxID=381308 RepID=A0A4R8IJE5_9GAMM|nr:pteridine reductase [Thiohalophilus thiocyanatoxydans]TDX98168.1 pteridine reductase [Thiohalophilus thiocyanatoxydans]
MSEHKVVLITGAAHRIGATTARLLHEQGMNIVLHYRHSREAAEQLQLELEHQRADSVVLAQADLHHTNELRQLAKQAAQVWGRLDVLINNASTFYPTPVESASIAQWDDLMGSNVKAPFFLSQAAAPYLQEQQGCIVNIVDIHAERPLRNFPLYSMAKASLGMMTKALAAELGPEIRVNGVAPGAILWPENLEDEDKEKIISRTFLKRRGSPDDIAKAILYLIRDADYMTGQILAVDGGRSLNS